MPDQPDSEQQAQWGVAAASVLQDRFYTISKVLRVGGLSCDIIPFLTRLHETPDAPVLALLDAVNSGLNYYSVQLDDANDSITILEKEISSLKTKLITALEHSRTLLECKARNKSDVGTW